MIRAPLVPAKTLAGASAPPYRVPNTEKKMWPIVELIVLGIGSYAVGRFIGRVIVTLLFAHTKNS